MLTREQIESQLGFKVNKISYSSLKGIVYIFEFEWKNEKYKKFSSINFTPLQLKSPRKFASQLFKYVPYKLPYISDELFDYLTSLWLDKIDIKRLPSSKLKYFKFLEEYFNFFLKDSPLHAFKGKRIFRLKDFILYLRILKVKAPRWQILYFLRRNGWEPHSNGSFRSWSKPL